MGDLFRRIKLPDGRQALNDPQVLSALLHIYGIGYRRYMLYGVEHWTSYKENIPAFRKKIMELRSEIKNLKRAKPEGWRDLSRRYEDAINGLNEWISRAEKRTR